MQIVKFFTKMGIISIIVFSALLIGGTLIVEDALHNDHTTVVKQVVQTVPDKNSQSHVKTDVCEYSFNEHNESDNVTITQGITIDCINRPSPPAPVTVINPTTVVEKEVQNPLAIGR
jgi:hypothetical protein